MEVSLGALESIKKMDRYNLFLIRYKTITVQLEHQTSTSCSGLLTFLNLFLTVVIRLCFLILGWLPLPENHPRIRAIRGKANVQNIAWPLWNWTWLARCPAHSQSTWMGIKRTLFFLLRIPPVLSKVYSLWQRWGLWETGLTRWPGPDFVSGDGSEWL